MSFDRSQQSYYVREINRALPTAPQMSVNSQALDEALGEPGSGQVHLESLLTAANAGAAAHQRDAACRALPYPGPGMRDPAARVGCGWWFSPDPSRMSIGAYGTRRGPMDPTLDTSIGPGRWVWDPREAQRLEGMKRVANIRSCPDIQYSTFPNVGWCQGTGMAILTDGAGNPLFPQSPGGDCPGQAIITNPAACPVTPSPAAGGAGAGAGGNLTPGITDLCTTGPGGALSPQCLSALAGGTELCSSQGTLALALSRGYAGTDSGFNSTNAALASRGFQIHPGIVNDGKLTVSDALNSIGGLRQVATSGDGSRASKAAANLCFGSPYNPCDIPLSQQGPWDDYADCIATAARERGYSPQGGIIPGNIGMDYWNQSQLHASWSAVLANLDWWKTQAHNQADPNFQKLAIGNVYGLNMNFPPQTCPTPVYSAGTWGTTWWDANWAPQFPGNSNVQWIWVTQNPQSGAPVGNAQMTYSYFNNTGADLRAQIFVGIDDYLTQLTVNNTNILSNVYKFGSVTFVMQPGANNFVFNVQNTGGPAGMAVICKDMSGNALFVSDTNFNNKGYQ